MANQPKKPRNIKDLKARLGRTIAPNQQQGQGAGVPPSNAGQGQPPQQGGVVPPPGAGGGPGGGPPPPGLPGTSGPGGVAPPPFMQKKKQKKSADPFGAPGAGAEEAKPQEVRLVVDEKPVDDAEVGRKARFRTMILVGVGALVGIGVGAGIGTTVQENSTYNATVRDGKEVYEKVKEAKKTVQEARGLVNRAVDKANGAPGSPPAVDFEAIEQLRALEKPFKAADFTRKKYSAWQEAVDPLFDYYIKVNGLWDKFQTLAARTLPKDRRQTLQQAAEAAEDVASTQTGCVPIVEDEQPMQCGLVYVHKPGEDTEEGKVLVSQTLRGTTGAKTPYQGQEDLLENPSNYVILTQTEESAGVLGQQASLFEEYRRELLEVHALMKETMKSQGQLEKGLGGVATLEERFAF